MLNKDVIIENLQEEIYDLEKKIENLECDKEYLNQTLTEQEYALREKYKARCWVCGSPLIWSSDFSYEDYGIIDTEGFVAVLNCTGCDTTAEFYCTTEEETVATEQ